MFQVEIALRAALSAARNRHRRKRSRGPTHLFICLADHFEPQVGSAPPEIARPRLEDWLRRYPLIADNYRDADGVRPQHTFFYPWDEFDAWDFDHLQEMCSSGYGEIELHLHHQDDTAQTLRSKLQAALAAYRRAGALSQWKDGRPAFGFVHGNWALDNSRVEGGRNYCGVNNELQVLAEAGCYADFTFPAWPQRAQPRQTNSIFYAIDDPARPKSYDQGVEACLAKDGKGDLLLIQGPLMGFRRQGGGGQRNPIAMDDGDLASYRRYAPSRLDRWVRAGIHIRHRPEWVFVKLHCHGAADQNRAALLDNDLNAFFLDAERRYNDGQIYTLHYVTAREMYNLVKAAELRPDLDVASARNWLLPPPQSP